MINIKNELFSYWKEFHDKVKSDNQFIEELEKELNIRANSYLKKIHGIPENPSGINELNGGLY